MNDLMKSGYCLGDELKHRGFEEQARMKLHRILNGNVTYKDKVDCIMDLSFMTQRPIPLEIIEDDDEEFHESFYMVLIGLVNGLNKKMDDVVTIKEASEIVNRDVSSINRAISSGRLAQGRDCRKSGATWLIERNALMREFKVAPDEENEE